MIAIVTMMSTLETVQASANFHLEKDPQGLIRPFRAVMVPLPEFVREYGRFTSTPILVGGNWDKELKGSVTLFLRRPLKQEELTNVFHRVLADNGYAVVDGSAGNGWIIEKTRDARDDALPVYDILEVPDSSRLVTAYHNLKYVSAESVARTMRSFMPANSRIIPTSQSQIFITDIASNIRKLEWVISRMDTPEGAKRQRESSSGVTFGPPRTCGEQRIEKLVVEKLEIQDNGSMRQAPPMTMVKEGGRK
jgi:type II secretory pathway component GspD/PulD (secretin)